MRVVSEVNNNVTTLAGFIHLSRREDLADQTAVLVITGGRVD